MNQLFKRVLLAFGLTVFLITGCSALPKNMNNTSSQDNSGSDSDYDRGEKPGFLPPDHDRPADQILPGVLNQKLVKSAVISLSAKDIEIAQAEIQRIASQFKGYVYQMEQAQTTAQRFLTITIKVASTDFDKAIELIKQLGKVTNVTLNVSDVTTQFIDTQAHIKTLKTKEETLNNLLAKASSIEDILKIETSLQETRQEIESFQGQLNVLKNSTDFSKITIYVNDEAGLVTSQPESPWTTFKSQYNRGLRFWGNAAIELLANLLFLLPFLIVLLVLGLFLKFTIKRKPNSWKKRRTSASLSSYKRGDEDESALKNNRGEPDSSPDSHLK